MTSILLALMRFHCLRSCSARSFPHGSFLKSHHSRASLRYARAQCFSLAMSIPTTIVLRAISFKRIYKKNQKERREAASNTTGMKKKAKRENALSLKRLEGLCKGIPDERRHSGNWRHRLADILVICLLGIICGHETWEEIYDYATAKRLFLWRRLGFKHGIPSPETLRRVMGMIRPEALEDVYRQ